jgi:hypothetical protein
VSKLPSLKRTNHFWAVLSAMSLLRRRHKCFGRPLQLGASIELIKKKVSEIFIFLNLTLHSFGPETFVPLVQIGKLQNGLIEENESYKTVYYK